MDLPSERRIEERTGCNLPARIEADGVVFACVVVDISETGARIAVAADVDLPHSFDLMVPAIPGADQRFRVVTRWRRDGLLGGAFG